MRKMRKNEKDEKNEKKSNYNNKDFFTLLFYVENLYFARKYIWKTQVYIVTFPL